MQNGWPRLWPPGEALGAGGAAGEEAGAELPWEQGAVLRCHPQPRPSESVFLLFQLKEETRATSPSPAISSPLPCSLPALMGGCVKASCGVQQANSTRQRWQRGQPRVLVPLCITRKGSCLGQ